ncbi:MAG: demethylmenaquinone methyltransferase / 2-methoxy-6-polyprenyl,4-benzoquinol methylase [Actinomycetota bacterium]|nr:demethylmenaquinone methyltransferase / 2-methoxy-6-polyprenyl,4-benzoquinol methylase [Actinomycetota bacterium]
MKPRDTLPTGQEKVKAVRTMFDAIAPRYDLLNRILTFGMDTGWRRKTVADLGLPPGSLVLDLACGTGDFCNDLAAAALRAVGFDNSAGMLSAATTAAPLVLADALKLPVQDASADGITCGFALRNVADLGSFFGEVARVVRPGGRIGLLEVAEPRWRPARVVHGMYFRKVVPLIGGLLSDRAAYRYLPASTAYLPEPADMLAMLRASGFPDARRQLLFMGAAQLITGTRA